MYLPHDNPLRGLGRAFLLLIALLILSALGAGYALAATTLTPSATSANGQLDTTLTWESDRTQCTASGHPSFSGPVASSGTVALPTITMSGTYTVSLTCITPASLSAKLTWTNPTKNTDGTDYTNPSKTRIYYGTNPSALTQTTETNHPSSTLTLEGLAPGEWYFGARAVNTNNAEGEISDLVVKVTQAGGSDPAETVVLTVNPVPGKVTNLAVE